MIGRRPLEIARRSRLRFLQRVAGADGRIEDGTLLLIEDASTQNAAASELDAVVLVRGRLGGEVEPARGDVVLGDEIEADDVVGSRRDDELAIGSRAGDGPLLEVAPFETAGTEEVFERSSSNEHARDDARAGDRPAVLVDDPARGETSRRRLCDPRRRFVLGRGDGVIWRDRVDREIHLVLRLRVRDRRRRDLRSSPGIELPDHESREGDDDRRRREPLRLRDRHDGSSLLRERDRDRAPVAARRGALIGVRVEPLAQPLKPALQPRLHGLDRGAGLRGDL